VVVIANGARDPMIPAAMTAQLTAQFRERGADVVELPHPGGHRIDPRQLPQIASIVSHPERPA
jgi:phospholipase/carboxylesterase